LIIDKKK